jgi:FkbM family methyltransferase
MTATLSPSLGRDFKETAPWGTYTLGALTRGWLGLCHALGALPAGRRLALWARHPLKHRLNGPVDARLWGYRLRLMPRGNLSESRWLFLPHRFDRAERRFWREHLQAGDVFIDVGANAGSYSFWAAHWVGQPGRVVSIEPDPALQQQLRFNLTQNQLTNVQVVGQALGEAAGEAPLIVGQTNRGENALASGETSPPTDGESFTVPVRTLGEVCDELGIDRIAGLKIDIEGWEQTVLAQFFATAEPRRYPRFIQFEKGASQQATALEALVRHYGYQRLCEGRMNAIFGRPSSSDRS